MKKNARLFSLIFVVILVCSQISVYAAQYNCAEDKHKLTIIDKVPNTRKIDGYITYECALCGYTYTKCTYATDHKWSEWKVIKKPNCFEPGYMRRTCSAGATHFKTKSIPVTGHDYEEEIIRKPSCTEFGEKIFTCTNCNDRYKETYGVIDGHDYEEEITREPSCTEKGEKTFTCIDCGDSYTESFGDIIKHDYKEKIAKKPSCTEEGVKSFICTDCKDSHTEKIDAIGHKYGEWIIETSASEGKEGNKYKECGRCEDRKHKVIKAIESPKEEEQNNKKADKKEFEIPLSVSIAGIVSAVTVDIVLIYPGASMLLWVRRRKKEILEDLDREEKDRYDFI